MDENTYQVAHFNVDVIISVGYRVKSVQGDRFRKWATRSLPDHLVRACDLSRSAMSKITRCPGYGT